MLLIRRPDPQCDSLSAACSPVWSCFGQVSYRFFPPFTSTPLGPLPSLFLFPIHLSCPPLVLSLYIALCCVGWFLVALLSCFPFTLLSCWTPIKYVARGV
jgi:hypothetical protein